MENQKVAVLIQKREWKDVVKTLKIMKDACEVKCDNCSSHHSLLHLACRFEAPLNVIKKIFKVGEYQIRQQDCLWRLPLHVAARYEAPYDVIEFLIKKNISAASRADVEENTPIHIALLGYEETKIQHEYNLSEFNEYFLRVIKLLCHVAPSSVGHKNIEDLSAAEIAIDKSVKPDVLVALWAADKSAMTQSGRKLIDLYKRKKTERKSSFTERMVAKTNPVRRRSTMMT